MAAANFNQMNLYEDSFCTIPDNWETSIKKANIAALTPVTTVPLTGT